MTTKKALAAVRGVVAYAQTIADNLGRGLVELETAIEDLDRRLDDLEDLLLDTEREETEATAR
ncbi:MAG: hypothetical protein QN162_14470 [Armatimonadota bacterium]|nr:hypothetical protein [Armatimonadota bacterium]